KITLNELDYDLSYRLKHNQDNPRGTHQELFKKLSDKKLGAWYELSHADIFFYAVNVVSPMWLYPEGKVSLRQLLSQALVDSELPQSDEFIKKYEQYLIREGEHAA